MTIQELLNTATTILSKTSDSPGLDTEVLLSFVLKKPKEYLAVRMHQYVPLDLKKQFFKLINYRRQGWPVAYLTKKKEFFGLDFYVNKNVLIPRPETEGLVELVLENLKGKKKLKILDVGTGSGNIIITIARSVATRQSLIRSPRGLRPLAMDNNQYFASDVSASALRIARKNAKSHKTKITFRQGDLLKPWKNQNFDVVVANLPYLAKRTDRSTKFEPTNALIAKKKGLALYEKLFREINSPRPPLKLRGGGRPARLPVRAGGRPGALLPSLIFVEIGHDQGSAIKKTGRKISACLAGRRASF